ncbi:tail collar fiber protein [Caudoviricetes sp.]|nr:tail collar fiber protein [Caudoviricetes sp.]
MATVITNVGKGIAAKRMLGASPAQAEPKFLGIGTGVHTAAATDTALTTEVETRSGTNAGTTVTTTQTNDTYQVIQTITATATRSIVEAGLFDASTAGNMFLSADFASVGLVSGDSIQVTAKCQFT